MDTNNDAMASPDKSFEDKMNDLGESMEKAGVEMGEKIEKGFKKFFEETRAGRIMGSLWGILWILIFLFFITTFYRFIPFITDAFAGWVPIAIITMGITIIIHIVLILVDKRLIRGILKIIIDVLSLISNLALLAIFPFDFSTITELQWIGPVVQIVLAVICFALIVAIIVKTVTLLTSTITGSSK
jgi:hypothetical protein